MKKITLPHFAKGFTLVEMLVVVAIISLLSGITLVSLSGSRNAARDNIRISTIQQLQLTMRLYVEQYGSDIDCENGVYIDGSTSGLSGSLSTGACTDAAQILSFIESHMGEIPHDPLGPDNPDAYYYFDNNHDCLTSAIPGTRPLLFALHMENIETNILDVCEHRSGSDGKLDDVAYEPYVVQLDFTRQN